VRGAPPKETGAVPGGTVLRLFLSTARTRQVLVLLCLLLGGLAESVGIASLLPLLSIVGGDSEATASSPLHRALMELLAFLHLKPSLSTLFGLILGGLWLRGLLLLVAMSFVGAMVAELATGLRLALLDALLRAQWLHFVRHPVGRYANAMSVEVARAAESYLAVGMCLSQVIQASFYAGMALFLSWRLGLMALGMGALVVVLLNLLVRVMRRAGMRQTQRTQALVSRFSDMLVGIKGLKAMGQRDELGDLLRTSALRLNTALRRQVIARQALHSLREPLVALLLGLALSFAVGHPEASLPSLLVMSLVLVRTLMMVGRAMEQYQLAVAGESAYWSVRTLIDEAIAEEERAPGRLIPTLTRACTFDRVGFAYRDRQVLDAVSVILEVGRVTVLSGPSGTGKTTLVDLLVGLHRPTSGVIRIDEAPLEEVDLLAWRRQIGYVPQEVSLFNDTLLANVTLQRPGFSRADVETALRQAGAWELVAALPAGLDTEVGERGGLLSGGERQRIALARALLGRPRLLILDEATSALDPEREALLCHQLAELCHEGGMAILAIAHQPAWARVADQVYRITEGQVTEERASAGRGTAGNA
jgi:ATP-binding cassette, subfamily C, bacterial